MYVIMYLCAYIVLFSLIRRGCHGLERINISWCNRITDEGITALASGCNKLYSITCKGCNLVSTDLQVLQYCSLLYLFSCFAVLLCAALFSFLLCLLVYSFILFIIIILLFIYYFIYYFIIIILFIYLFCAVAYTL